MFPDLIEPLTLTFIHCDSDTSTLTFPKPNIPLPQKTGDHHVICAVGGTAGGSWNNSVITAACDATCLLNEASKTGSILGVCIFTNLMTGMLYLVILNLGSPLEVLKKNHSAAFYN